jgi:4-methylaminobutanoate oxidase (formaldehyde-forming)
MSENEFLLVTSSGSVVRDVDWIGRHAGVSDRVEVVDLSSDYAVYGVMGPKSRALLQKLTRVDLSDGAFPFGTSREIDLGHATARATRITYVGELGWELYVPAEFAVGVFELLMEKGEALGVVNAGYWAMNSMRLEKAYRAWGSDLTPDYGPVEAGLLFACDLASERNFLGRRAVEKVRAEGPRRRLVSLVLGDPEPMLWGSELIRRDGVASGQVTSAGWAKTLGAGVALGYVWGSGDTPVTPAFLREGSYDIDIEGRSYPARLHLRAPLDPDNARIR